MSNIFSLSFSNSNIQIAHLVQNGSQEKLVSLNTFDYPFAFKFDQLFFPEHISAIGEIINKHRENAEINDLSLMVSLPMNYALQKKIALPNDIEQNVINEQVEWELSHYLPGQLSEFKVIMTESSFDFDGYKEVLFICIKKEIIKNINALAKYCMGVLSKLIVDNIALENYINRKKIIDTTKNQILFNIDVLQFISHLFFNGKYYYSYSENINPLKTNSFEEKIIKLSKEQYLTIKNLNEQLPFGNGKELEIFIYGQAFSDSLLDKLRDNFSCNVGKFENDSYPNLSGIEIAGYIEALGTCY